MYLYAYRYEINQRLPRKSNEVEIECEFVIHKNKDYNLQQDTETTANSTNDVNLESPSEKGSVKKFVGKMADKITSGAKAVSSGVKAVGKTIGSVLPINKLTKTKPLYEKKWICPPAGNKCFASEKGTDKKGNPIKPLITTRLIRHVDIAECNSVSISVKPKNCHLTEPHLFVRFV